MHPRALLELAGELIRDLLAFEAPADSVVSTFFRARRSLGQRERHALAEAAYDVLRRRLLYQQLAQSGSGALPRRLAILACQGDAAFLQAALTPDERAWRAAMLAVDTTRLAPELRHNLPGWLSEPLLAELGEAEFWALAESLMAPAPLDLRVNVLKTKRTDAQAQLAQAGIRSEPTPYSPWGLRLHGKPALNKLDIYTRGDVEVQDEGSQLLALLTGAKRGETVVDFCAGAGGKTLALGAAMRNTGRLYAFDVSGHRLNALKPRLARSGLSNVYAVQIAHERDERIQRLAGKIDRVLVDAPCSGLGTLRRNPDLKWRQSPGAVRELAVTQAAILESAARLVKPGGRLVYATCSLLRGENEGIAERFAQAHPQFADCPAHSLIDFDRQDGRFLRLWPHRHATDGFFAAVWERR